MSFNSMFEDGYRKVKSEFAQQQKDSIAIIAEARNMPPEWIEAARGIFIPNDEFMLEVFGKEVLEYECYSGTICIWNNALIFPVTDVNGRAVGFGGFFPFDYLDEECDGNYYAYSSSSVMRKGNYLYFPQKTLMDAIQDGYLILVDGMFDAISLAGAGYNAAALMGSSPTQQIMAQLRFIKQVIVIADNDEAGYKLFSSLRRCLNNIVLFKQGKTKDADDLLKSEFSEKFTHLLDEMISSKDMFCKSLDM